MERSSHSQSFVLSSCRAVVGQVYVAEPGYVLGRAAVPKFAIITTLAGTATPDLVTFCSVLSSLQHGARVPLEYYTFSERHRRKSSILQVCRGQGCRQCQAYDVCLAMALHHPDC